MPEENNRPTPSAEFTETPTELDPRPAEKPAKATKASTAKSAKPAKADKPAKPAGRKKAAAEAEPEEPEDKLDIIFEGLRQKSAAKQAIFRNAQAAFECLRTVTQELVLDLTRRVTSVDSSVVIEYRPVNELEFHIRFSGDLLVFVMHSNIITFPDDFPLFGSRYVSEDFRRRFFGHIMAYNFMADSIKYQRLNDPGYLVGRLLINIDNHYYIEGAKQLDLPDNDMEHNVVNEDAMRLYVESAMIAAVNNDLMAPPIQDIQKITVKQKLENQQVSRGSKVGFNFRNEQPRHQGYDGLTY
ncbi:hypothetical protein LJ737_24700 [Hymenobacter sp. 15J16-1T3B]|uniref:hypothetical protein n=1 Tax=Hymenobacter sp. 15J16-1T3B TaxID=2886941 RepID=UPI001D103AC1|nr:hypothetical protein [Hymenobacter sp. 15J16-1T3B]MCC3160460.1 hypothetical protein [Hymenobacter sp. 15J16-1T3B]